MPAPNNYTQANTDGLNVGSAQFIRHYRGLDNLFSVGEGTGDRKQINVRIDHNLNTRHKVNFGITRETVVSDDTVAGLPGTWSNQNFHKPVVVTTGFVSTLSASIVNETAAPAHPATGGWGRSVGSGNGCSPLS